MSPAELVASWAAADDADAARRREERAHGAMNDFRAAFDHKSCIVREGAVFGAARLAQRFPAWSPDVVRLLADAERSDESPGVREAAREALEDLQ